MMSRMAVSRRAIPHELRIDMQYHSGQWCLDLTEADKSLAEFFDDRGLEGGGYTWEGILRALVEIRLPEALPRLDFGAEADNMNIYSDDRILLELVAALARSAAADRRVLVAAIKHAGEDLESSIFLTEESLPLVSATVTERFPRPHRIAIIG